MNVPDDLKTEYKRLCDVRHEVGICASATMSVTEAITLIERIADLEAKRTVAINAEKTDCTKALVALSAAGIDTPEETYGYNTSWAISELCRAVAALSQQVAT